MSPRAGIRGTTLVIVGLATTILAWLVLRWWHAAGNGVADPSWIGGVVMAFLGAALLVAGWQVKQVRDGTAERFLSPLRAARTLVLGQAGALTGAVLTGWYAANALVLWPDADVESQRERMLIFAAHTVIAVLLAGTGMVVQRWCRLRGHDDEDKDDGAVEG